MPNRLMVLGGSYAQVDVIERAEREKIQTVVVDKDPKAVGFQIASYALNVSVKDTTSIIKFARSMKINGIIAPEADAGLLTMGEVVSELGLKGPGKMSMLAAQDKRITKLCFQHAGVKTPKLVIFDEVHDCNYPLVIKPVDGVCSRGVYLVDDPSEWSEFLVGESRKHSAIGEVMVEEFISGTVFNMDMMLQDGVVMYAMLHDEIVNESNFGVSYFIAPSQYNNYRAVIEHVCTKAAKALGIRDGCIAVEGVVKGNGTVYILEINPRMSGSFHIPAHELSTGIDWCGDAIKVALGEKIERKAVNFKPHGWVMVGSRKAGTIKDIKRTIPFTGKERIQYLKYAGDQIGDFYGTETSTDQTVYIFYTEQNTMYDVLIRLQEAIKGITINVG
jgi:biotin carboxylase